MLHKVLNRLSQAIADAQLASNMRELARNGSLGRVTADVVLRHPEHTLIGGSYVNGGMLAASDNAKIVIGRDCMVSYGVNMRTDMHRHGRLDVSMNAQGNDEADIVIADDVWVGYGAQIMSGVTVGSHAIVGDGAVVTRDVPEWAVAGGVPALHTHAERIVKFRPWAIGP